MTMPKVVDRSIDETIQSRVREEARDTVGSGIMGWLTNTNALIPDWWSPSRDNELAKQWKKVDHVAGSIYTLQSRMTTIPFRVLPIDRSIKAHVKQADQYTELLLHGTEFGEGWVAFFEKQVESLLTQDNGRFAEIIAPGNVAGAITGRPISIVHLDPSRCTRTGIPEFPVVYTDKDGKKYKLHYTRVMFDSQMPSAFAKMNGVGFSALSRMLNIAQNLLDILTYKQEKLGSRPHRQLMITKGGLDPTDLINAFRKASMQMDAQGLERYAKTVVVGDSTLHDATIEAHDIASLPDGFDQKDDTMLGMAVIALALGVDARELFPNMGSGATRADALLSHIKQRGKGPGQILIKTENLFNQKFLPSHLKLVFDHQDDAQDNQVAEIQEKRSLARERNLQVKVTTLRVERERMVMNGEITEAQFLDMEMEDGRMMDGTSILSLFSSDDPDIAPLLKIPGVTDPLDVVGNQENVESVLEGISKATVAIYEAQLVENQEKRLKARQAEKAMEFLAKMYEESTMFQESEEPTEEEIQEAKRERPEEDTDPQPETASGDTDAGALRNEGKMEREDMQAKEWFEMRFQESLDTFDRELARMDDGV